MLQFIELCGLTFMATTLLATGVSHLAGMGGFSRLLRQHGVLPAALAAPGALVVTATELATGLVAMSALRGDSTRLTTASFGAGLVLGGTFVVYLRRLVAAGHTGSCGCSPLASSLTPASFVPAASLVTVGAAGLLARASATSAVLPTEPWSALAIAWGLALSLLVLLLPATAPGNVAGARP